LNVLKPNLRISIQTLLQAGKAQREIARVIGVDRKTVRRIAEEAKSPGGATGFSVEKVDIDGQVEGQNPPPRPPAPKPAVTPSACEVHREWIEAQVLLGRNAMRGPLIFGAMTGGRNTRYLPVFLGASRVTR
jgi:hypothetical protein